MKFESPSRSGDYSEHKVITWLLGEGWEVFKNVGCSGPVDIVGIDPHGQTVLIDVKTHILDSEGTIIGGRGRSDRQKELGVCIIYYNPSKDTFEFARHRDGTGYRHRNESDAQQDLALGF